VCDAPTLGRVLRWRIPNTPGDRPYRDVFRRYPFTVLDEGEHWSVSGLCAAGACGCEPSGPWSDGSSG
jgi:hypothetical protein